MAKLLEIYHQLPYPLRCLAASIRGFSLRWWRYGSTTEALVEETLDRDAWPLHRWQSWRETRLAFLLHRAATRVPYYRDYWSEQRRQGNRQSWEYLENWPVLTKEPLRSTPLAFVADDCNPRKMWREHTSGTTGKPLDLWWSRETVRRWYAIFEARARRWNGVSLHDPWSILGGQLVTPFSAARPPFWVWNAGLKQLYMSSYHLSKDFAPCYIQALRDHHICYLLGYPSSLYSLARFGVEQGIAPPALQVVLTNAEQLYPYQRQLMQDYFQCRVVNTYGMVEIVSAASECANGEMHLWPEVGFTEVLDEGLRERLGPGETGRLVGTGLLNADMPLIRYQIGDRGALKPEGETCACARPLPVLAEIEGRIDDVILTPDGRRVGRLGPVFRGPLPVFESQVIQESLNTLRVLVVPAAGFGPETREEIFSRLRGRVGDMHMTLETVESIPRSVNGKYRLIVSRLSALSSGRPQETNLPEAAGDRAASPVRKAERPFIPGKEDIHRNMQ